MVLPQGGITRRMGFQAISNARNPDDSTNALRLFPFKNSTLGSYCLEIGYNTTHGGYVRYYSNRAKISLPPDYMGIWWNSATVINELTYAQSVDRLYTFHRNSAPIYITYFGSGVDIWRDGPYSDPNSDLTKTLTASGTTGTVTITATGFSPFVSGDAGGNNPRWIRMKIGANWGTAQVATYISATQVTATVVSTLGGTTATTDWALGAFSNGQGWPDCGIFYEDRFWVAKDQTLYASEAGDYTSWSPSELNGTVIDSNGLVYTLATDDVHRIRHMSAGKVLSIFTTDGEFTVAASNLNEAITPTNVKVTRETTRGTIVKAKPQKIDQSTLYVQKNAKRIRDYSYDYGKDSYIAKDLTILADHFWFNDTIVDVSYGAEPHSVVWVVTASGLLYSLTYLPEQDVYAWQRHTAPGGDKYIAVCCVPNTNTKTDDVWVICKRVSSLGVNSGYYAVVECMSEWNFPANTYDYSWSKFVDSYAIYSGSATLTLTGLDHLAGRTVSGLCKRNGSSYWTPLTPAVVNGSGSVTFTGDTFTDAFVGVPYTSICHTVPIEAGGNEGSSQGKIGRTHRVAIRLFQTMGCKIGNAAGNLEEMEFRKPSALMDRLPELFTGIVRTTLPGGNELDRCVYIKTDEPLPCTVLGITPTLVVND
jgi:hypothetical protein